MEKKIVLSALCAGVVAYSYTVHTRFLISIVVLTCILLAYQIKYKKSAVSYGSLGLSFVLILVTALGWTRHIQGLLYETNIAGRVVNGNDALARISYVSTFLKALLGYENICKFIANLMSLMGSLTLLTGGLIWVFLIFCVKELIVQLKEKNNNPYTETKFILALSGVISFIGMCCLISINGLTNVAEYKWLTYYRYMRPFLGILLILGWDILITQKNHLKSILGAILGITLSMVIILFYTVPILMNANIVDVSPVGWFMYYFYTDQGPSEYFGSFICITLLISAIFILFIIKKRYVVFAIFFLIYSLMFSYSENQYNMNISDKNYEMVDETMKFMEMFDNNDINIYFVQGTYSGRLRYALYDISMQYILDIEQEKNIDYKNALILSDRENLFDNELVGPKYCIVLDDYEFAYTSDSRIVNKIKMFYPYKVMKY